MKVKVSPTTTERVNQLISTEEPSYPGLPTELSSHDIATALNWYNQHSDKEKSHQFLSTHCKVNGIKITPRQIEAQVPTLGFVCRMMSRGAVLDAKSQEWLNLRIKNLYSKKFSTEREEMLAPVPTVKPVTIQDRIKFKTSRCIGALEGLVDEYILSEFKTIPNFLSVLRAHEIKSVNGPAIINTFNKNRDEFSVAQAATDAEVTEAYNNYTVPQLRKMEKLYDQIMSDTLTVMGESKATKKKKTKKTK